MPNPLGPSARATKRTTKKLVRLDTAWSASPQPSRCVVPFRRQTPSLRRECVFTAAPSGPDVPVHVEDHARPMGVDFDGNILQPGNRASNGGLVPDRAADQDEPAAAGPGDLGARRSCAE